MNKRLETVCIEQQDIISQLSGLCRALLVELAQYRAIDVEEEQVKRILTGEEKHGDNP